MRECWVIDCHGVCGGGDRAFVIFDMTCGRFESCRGARGEDSFFFDAKFIINDVINDSITVSWNLRFIVTERDGFGGCEWCVGCKKFRLVTE